MMEAIKQSSRVDNSIRSSLLARSSTIPLISSQTIPAQIIQTLGDNSCPYIQQKNIYDIVAQFTSKRTIIRPQNKWLLAWHVIVMIILLYYIFEIGLLWGYGEAVWLDELAVLYSLNLIFIIILVADCLLSNVKAYYSHGLLVTHPRLIVKRYLKVRFYLDIIAVISILIPFISQSFILNWIKALFLLKIYQIYEIDKQFIRVSQLKLSYHTFYLLSRLVFFLILGSHYLGIWFYMIDYWVYANNYYGPNTPNLCWIYNAQAYSQLVLLQPWYGQYLYTMYFSIGTMTTIAYGDITPLNPIQTIYITFALIAYTIGFAYILSQILRILMQAQASKFEHTNNLLIVSNMMKNNMIKQKTQSKVKSYFQKVWKEEIYRNREVQNQLIQQLPQKIRNQLFTELYGSFFNALMLYFPGGESTVKTNFMVAIANQIRQQRLVQDHILYKYQQEYDPQNLNNHMYYFIKQLKKGRLKPSIQIGVKDLVIQTLTEGDVGIEGFYTGDPRDHWAKVILSVLVYQLPRSILLENIHLATQIQQQNIFLVAQNIYSRKCYVCKQLDHNFKQCPFVTYQPNKKLLIKYYLAKEFEKDMRKDEHDEEDEEEGGQRKTKIHYNTLILYKDIKHTKYKVRDKYQLMLNNKYYRELFSLGKSKQKKKGKKKVKDDCMVGVNVREKSYCGNRESKRKAYVEEMKVASKLSPKFSPKLSPKLGPSSPIKQMNLLEQSQDFQIQIQPFSKQHMPQIKISDIIHPQFKQQQAYSRQSSPPRQQRATTSNIPLNPFSIFSEAFQAQQNYESETSSSQTSSESSVDLQNYVKQTQLYIRHLEHFDLGDTQFKDHQSYHDLQYDIVKEYHVYNATENITEVIKKYNQGNMPKRRKADVIKYNPSKTYMEFGDFTIRGMLNQSLIQEDQREYSMGQIDRN